MGVNSIMNDAGRIGFVIKGDYSNAETYDFLDVVYYNNATYVAKKLTVGNEPQSSSEFWQVLMDGEVDFNDIAPTFLQAETRENISSGEKLPVLFGKIKKWYTDLKAVAFSGSYNDLSDTPTIPAAVAVKGNAESSYRTGNVNLTPANIGAVPTANVLDSRESITANTASGNVAGALGTKEINANLQSQIDTLNSNLSIPLIDDSGITIKDIILSKINGKIFAFRRVVPTDDAPVNESWGYTYIVIPINGSVHMVVAYRAYTSSSMYQRTIDSNGWSNSWYVFGGKAIS